MISSLVLRIITDSKSANLVLFVNFKMADLIASDASGGSVKWFQLLGWQSEVSYSLLFFFPLVSLAFVCRSFVVLLSFFISPCRLPQLICILAPPCQPSVGQDHLGLERGGGQLGDIW